MLRLILKIAPLGAIVGRASGTRHAIAGENPPAVCLDGNSISPNEAQGNYYLHSGRGTAGAPTGNAWPLSHHRSWLSPKFSSTGNHPCRGVPPAFARHGS